MIAAAPSASYERLLNSAPGGPTRVRAAVFAKDALPAELYGRPDSPSAPMGNHGPRAASASDDSSVPERELRQRAAERTWLADRFGLPPERVAVLKQVHGRQIVEVRAGRSGNLPRPGDSRIYLSEADALFTEQPDVLLTIRTADCLPLFFDLRAASRTIVGLVHAGWRGLSQGIVSLTLERALDALIADSAASDKRRRLDPGISGTIFIGPCIGGDVYEVGEDVARHFSIKERRPSPPGRPEGEAQAPAKYLLDLAGNARVQIDAALHAFAERHGRDPAALRAEFEFPDDFAGCTYDENAVYFSHRRGDSGRNLNAIVIASE